MGCKRLKSYNKKSAILRLNSRLFCFLFFALEWPIDGLDFHLLVVGRQSVNLVFAALVVNFYNDVSIVRVDAFHPLGVAVCLAGLFYNVLR